MWDSVVASEPSGVVHLSHDRPCQQCGHAAHTYLPCSDSCGCRPARVA